MREAREHFDHPKTALDSVFSFLQYVVPNVAAALVEGRKYVIVDSDPLQASFKDERHSVAALASAPVPEPDEPSISLIVLHPKAFLVTSLLVMLYCLERHVVSTFTTTVVRKLSPQTQCQTAVNESGNTTWNVGPTAQSECCVSHASTAPARFNVAPNINLASWSIGFAQQNSQRLSAIFEIPHPNYLHRGLLNISCIPNRRRDIQKLGNLRCKLREPQTVIV